MIARETLPDNKNELKSIVYQLIDVMEEQKRLIANQNERIDAQFLRIEALSLKNEEQSQDIKVLSLKNEEQSQQLQAQAQQLTTQSQKIEEQSQQIDQLTHQVNSLKRHRYGKRSEKVQEDDSKQNDSNTQPSSPDAHVPLTHSPK